ncbi:MAG: (2Fe-2S)-binding protein [bacterium]|nr:(2Fe-2S)-binding protein [bacterium]
MSKPKIFLCRCEDVTVDEFTAAFREGFTELESLKRYTGVGTGFCQGKGCLCEATGELARLRELEPGDIRLTTIRPPSEPLTFSQLATLQVPDPAADPEETP